MASPLAAKGRFPSRKDLWYYLRLYGVAEEHHHQFFGFSRRYGNAMQAVALVAPPTSHRAGRCVVLSMASDAAEGLEGFNEQLHNSFESKSPVLVFGQPPTRPEEVVYDGVYYIANEWQSLGENIRREWWWRLCRASDEALMPPVIELSDSNNPG